MMEIVCGVQQLQYLLPTKGHVHLICNYWMLISMDVPQGEVVLRDGMYISDADLQMIMEGVYVWPIRQLRMVLSR